MVITRQTLGWIEDSNTKRRKEKDWIATSQMEQKTGLSKKAISLAISSLVDQDLIQVFDKTGKQCSLPGDRKGKLRLYYRLNLMSKGNTYIEKDMQNIPKLPITSVYFTEQGQLNRHTTKETITKQNGEKDFTWEDFLIRSMIVLNVISISLGISLKKRNWLLILEKRLRWHSEDT